MNNLNTVPIRQLQCGLRNPGDVYHTWEPSLQGLPFWNLAYCPPIPIPEELDLCMQGVNPIDRGDGVIDIWDIYGLDNYPNLWDVFFEAQNAWISRKIPKPTIKMLTPHESSHYLIHPRAIVNNMDVYKNWEWECPKDIELHKPNSPYDTCLSLARVAMQYSKGDTMLQGRKFLRNLVCGASYEAKVSNVEDPEFQMGIFMKLPIFHLDLIADEDGMVDESTYDSLKKTGFDFSVAPW